MNEPWEREGAAWLVAWSVDSDWDLLTSPDFARSLSQGLLSLDLLRDR